MLKLNRVLCAVPVLAGSQAVWASLLLQPVLSQAGVSSLSVQVVCLQ